MKLEINEWGEGFEMTLHPETVEEFAQLLRLGKNANSSKPNVYTSFEIKPYCSIYLHKRKKSVQHNSVSPDSK